MKILGIIPSRFASTRFPGKPLADIHGKSMIQRVYEQANSATLLDTVVIATDDTRILSAVKAFGGNSMLTSDAHQSGTDRCAEVARHFPEFDVIINIQGDEPFISPEQIDTLITCFENSATQIATLIKKITTEEELLNTNTPKVVVSTSGEAIYFSRNTIPFIRNAEKEQWHNLHTFYKHIGIYGYNASVLQNITKLPPSLLETMEQLEQLRWIENGYTIQTKVTTIESISVDTPEDLEKIKNKFF